MKLSTKVNKAENTGSSVKLHVEPAKGGNEEVLEADVVLVAAGEDVVPASYQTMSAADPGLTVLQVDILSCQLPKAIQNSKAASRQCTAGN